jgi:hypothetical protein
VHAIPPAPQFHEIPAQRVKLTRFDSTVEAARAPGKGGSMVQGTAHAAHSSARAAGSAWEPVTHGSLVELQRSTSCDLEQHQKLEELIAAAELVEAHGAQKGGSLPLLSPGWSNICPAAAGLSTLKSVQTSQAPPSLPLCSGALQIPVPTVCGSAKTAAGDPKPPRCRSPEDSPPVDMQAGCFLPPGHVGSTIVRYTVRACAVDPTAIHEGATLHIAAFEGASMPHLSLDSPCSESKDRLAAKHSDEKGTWGRDDSEGHLGIECPVTELGGSLSNKPCSTARGALPQCSAAKDGRSVEAARNEGPEPVGHVKATRSLMAFLISPVITSLELDPSNTLYAPVPVKVSTKGGKAQHSAAMLLMPQPQQPFGVPLPLGPVENLCPLFDTHLHRSASILMLFPCNQHQ